MQYVRQSREHRVRTFASYVARFSLGSFVLDYRSLRFLIDKKKPRQDIQCVAPFLQWLRFRRKRINLASFSTCWRYT